HRVVLGRVRAQPARRLRPSAARASRPRDARPSPGEPLMRHQRSGKKIGRDSAHRKALYSTLAGALIEHGRIRTTEAKAKAVKPFAEKMITLGKRGDLHARRQALARPPSNHIVHQLFADVAPRFADRPGGYTRIVRLGQRQGDAAEVVYLGPLDF